MMRELSDMVIVQGDKLDSFEFEVEESAEFTKSAVNELMKTDKGL